VGLRTIARAGHAEEFDGHQGHLRGNPD
jgi:hypothetical protein